MKISYRTLCAAALVAGTLIFGLPSSYAADTSKIPVKAFASLPDFSNPKLSPDGQHIAVTMHYDGRSIMVVQKLDGSERVIIPQAGNAEIRDIHWANNNRLLVVYSFVDEGFGDMQSTRLASVDRHDVKDFKWIVLGKKERSVTSRRPISGRIGQYQNNIVDFLPDDPDHFLLSIDSDMNGQGELRKINVYSGKYKELIKERNGIQNWYVGPTHQATIGTGYKGSTFRVVYKNQENGKWTDLTKKDWYKFYDIVAVSGTDNIVYAAGSGHLETDKLVKLDVITGEVTENIFGHDKYDVESVIYHPDTGQPAGVSYMDDYWRIKYFDPGMSKIQRTVNKALKGQVNQIVEKAQGQEIYLIFSYTDRDPGVYYWYDRAKKRMHDIAIRRNDIDPEQMAPTKAVDIPVRDGSSIPGYLTLPLGKSAKDLPVIILPHGGPSGRDTADWDYWTQFLASRGYAVLRPNFRGSTGLGRAHFLAGRKQWGGLMQDDVTDATRWMIKEGIADPKRICIAGASYGGYAAIYGTIKEQGLYKCAVSVNGVMNIPSMKAYDKKFIGGRSWIKSMSLEGSKDKDISPYHRADAIKVPVLLMSSKDDTRVPYKQSKRLHKKLKKLKADSRYVEIKNGGHQMLTEASRATMLSEMEVFLQKHIGR